MSIFLFSFAGERLDGAPVGHFSSVVMMLMMRAALVVLGNGAQAQPCRERERGGGGGVREREERGGGYKTESNIHRLISVYQQKRKFSSSAVILVVK